MKRHLVLSLLFVAVVGWSVTARPAAQSSQPAARAPLTATQSPSAAPAAFTAEDMLKVASVSVLDLSDDGRRVAVSSRRSFDNAEVDNYRYGDPTYNAPSRARLLVIDTTTGAALAPFKDLVNLRQAVWAHDSTRLAIVLAEPAESATPPAANAPARSARPTARPLVAKVAPPAGPVVYIWDAAKAALAAVPITGDLAISANSSLEWTPDDTRLVLTFRTPGWERDASDRFKAITAGPVIVHSSADPFLDWDALQRSTRRRILGELDLATGVVTRLMPEQKLSSYNVARDGSFVTFLEDVTEKTDYDEINGTTNALKLLPRAPGGAVRTIVEGKDLNGLTLRWSDDGRTFAYAKKGEVFVQSVDAGAKPRNLTPPPPGEKEDDKTEPAAATATRPGDAAKDDKKETFAVGPFSRDGSKLLITSKKGWYVVNVADAKRELVLALNEEDEEKNPKMDAVAWSPDGADIYVSYGERDRWERGFDRLTVAMKRRTPLVRDARLYSGFRMSRDGSTVLVSISDGDRPADLYATSPDLRSLRKLTDANSWLADRPLPKSELVSYRDADGKVLYGVLRYPANYVKGQKYPTIFEIYETFFDNGFNARAAFLANHGYAVFHPSVNLVIGRPGEAWVKGVTSAANKLIEMGVADPERLGVHGTSYGGYATVLLITETDRFKAAVNVSGKVDMVSFYTDSPRLGVRNIHAPEKSQDRLGATLWEHPELYLDHSAILHADRIKTPLLCITGDQDPNVPPSQSREIYYALRRLGREVEWVHYVNGAHRPPNSVAESIDFEQRILAWYDKHLKGDLKKKTTD
jgi:dipeptidyl aminopeptidase/acylaminoacyl peptidase